MCMHCAEYQPLHGQKKGKIGCKFHKYPSTDKYPSFTAPLQQLKLAYKNGNTFVYPARLGKQISGYVAF